MPNQFGQHVSRLHRTQAAQLGNLAAGDALVSLDELHNHSFLPYRVKPMSTDESGRSTEPPVQGRAQVIDAPAPLAPGFHQPGFHQSLEHRTSVALALLCQLPNGWSVRPPFVLEVVQRQKFVQVQRPSCPLLLMDEGGERRARLRPVDSPFRAGSASYLPWFETLRQENLGADLLQGYYNTVSLGGGKQRPPRN